MDRIKLLVVGTLMFAAFQAFVGFPVYSSDTEENLSLSGYHIAVCAIGTEHTWDATCFKNIVARLKELGAEVTAYDAERSDIKMKTGLESLINMNPDGLVIMLGALDVVKPAIEEAKSRGIRVVTCDSLPGEVNVSSNNFVAEAQVASRLAQDLGGKGKIGVFFRPGTAVAELRYRIFKAVIAQFPDIKVVVEEPYVLPGTVPDAYTKVKAWIKAHPDIKAIWTVFDIPLIGAAHALMEAGLNKQVGLYGFDGDPEFIRLMKEGAIFGATIAQNPALIGKTAAERLAKLIHGESVPAFVFIPAFLVTPENVEEIIKTFPDKYGDLLQ